GLGAPPVTWAGVALSLVAFVLFGMEGYVGGIGALGIGGAISLIAGGLLLTSTSNPDFQVSRWLVVTTGVVCAAFFAMFVATVLKARRMPPSLGVQNMIGRRAIARSDLDPQGFVFIQGERWRAVAEDGPVRRGEAVIVTGVNGLTPPKMFHRPHRLPIDEAVVAHRRCHHFPWTSQAHNNTWPLRQERQPCFERPAEPRILPRRRRRVGESAHLLRVRTGRRDYI